jgi:hypothetical protein
MIYAGAHGQGTGAALGTVKIGDKVTAPQAATVLSRSPKKKK